MRKINKILILFLVAMMISFMAVWQFVQSEFFAEFISDSISTYAEKKLNTNIKFEKLEFQLFPPGVNIKHIQLNKKDFKDYDLDFNLNSLGIFFNITDTFETKVTIKEIKFKEGVVRIFNNKVLKNVSKKTKKINFDKIPKPTEIKDLLKNKLPFALSSLNLEDIQLELNNRSIHLKKLFVRTKRNGLYLKSTIYNLDILKNEFGYKFAEADEFSINAIATDNNILIEKAYILKDTNRLRLNGVIDNYLSPKKMTYKLESNLEGYLPDVHKIINISEIGKINSGVVHANMNLKGNLKKFDISAKLDGQSILTDFINIKNAKVKLNITQDEIRIKKALMNNRNGHVTINKPFQLFDFKNLKWIEEPVILEMKNFELTNMLRYLKESLSPLKGRMFGKLKFDLGKNDFHFSSVEDFIIRSFKFKTEGEPIIQGDQVHLKNTSIDVYDDLFSFNSDISVNKSKFKLRGRIRNDTIHFEAKDSKINLEDIGPFSGLNIKGKGKLDLLVSGPLDDAKINFISKIKNFDFEKFYMDELESNITFHIGHDYAEIRDASGIIGKSKINGSGTVNYNTQDVRFRINHPKLSFVDFKRLYYPISKNMDFMPKEILGDWKTEYEISGKYELDKLIMKGKLLALNSYMYNENFEKIAFNYNLKDLKMNLENIRVQKGKGKIFTDFFYDINKEYYNYSGTIESLPIDELNNYASLPLTLKGKLDGIFRGNNKNKIESTYTHLYLKKSKVFNKNVEDSFLELKLDKNIMSIKGSLLGPSLKLDSNLDLSEDVKSNSKKSTVNMTSNIKDFKKILSLISGVDVQGTSLQGSIDMAINSKFNFNDWRKLDFDGVLNSLSIKKGDVKLNYKNNKKNIIINNGKIEKWKIKIPGSDFSIASKGKGSLTNDYNIGSRIIFDASLFEIFNNVIAKSDGAIIIQTKHFQNNRVEDYEVSAISNNFSLSTDFLPTSITKSSFKSIYRDKKIILDFMDAQLTNGKFYMDGDISFSNLLPEFNLKFNVDKAGFVLFKKSNATISGRGSILGSGFPYVLSGDFSILNCQITNEITDFTGSSNIISKDYQFLPKSNQIIEDSIFNFNININTVEPIKITNTMADLSFAGDIHVFGSENKPLVAGKVNLSEGINKVYFKNNEFLVTKGNVYFYEKEDYKNPELDFQAQSKINDFDVKLKIFGQSNSPDFGLSSEPPLSENDILSLVAFGYTDNLSNNLSSQERESITQTGVGSVIFDRLKINETLKSELGLQVNLGTEFVQDGTNYLSGRSSDVGTGTGQVRSATKIEVKKRLSEELNLSVSSTVGGSIGQKQSMNLIYNADKEVSLEGVYENRTNEEGQVNTQGNSAGFDLKFKKTFK